MSELSELLSQQSHFLLFGVRKINPNFHNWVCNWVYHITKSKGINLVRSINLPSKNLKASWSWTNQVSIKTSFGSLVRDIGWQLAYFTLLIIWCIFFKLFLLFWNYCSFFLISCYFWCYITYIHLRGDKISILVPSLV